jgi:hypothetical protein
VDRPPYAAALRLYAIAEARWAEIEAHYIAVDLFRLSPARFCNAVYAWCVKYMDVEDREKWEAMLTAPLPGAKPSRPTQAEVDAEGATFLAAMETLTGKKG